MLSTQRREEPKYLKIQGNSEVMLDEDKIAKDACWDGLHGVVTNSNNCSEQEILEHYHGLWQIEAAFRVSKHDLKIRPIFHWTADRIRAHIAIAFICLVCVRHLEYRVGLQHERYSPEVIRVALTGIQTSILKDESSGEFYGVPSSGSSVACKIYQSMGFKHSTVPFKLDASLGKPGPSKLL